MGIWDGTQPLPVGKYEVTISKVKTEFKGKPIVSASDGTPAIKIVFVDSESNESEGYFQLGGRMVWKFARILKACGHDPEKLTADQGITPAHFAMSALCNQYLVGHKFLAEVTERKVDDKTYIEVAPVKKDESKPFNESDIPF